MAKNVARIELARLRRDLTQGELERLAGLPNHRIAKWVMGTGEPTARQAARIARALGVDLGWLCDDEATEECRGRGRDLSPTESYVLDLAGRLGLDRAARLIADALLEPGRVGGPGGATAPAPGPPILVDVPRRRRVRSRKARG